MTSFVRRVLVGAVTAVVTLGTATVGFVTPSLASTGAVVLVGLNPDDSGSIGIIDPVTGLEISPIPNLAYFPSTPGDGISNVSGLAFNPVNGSLYAMNYDCEVIIIDIETGLSTPAATDFYNGNGSECEGLAINADGVLFAGTHTDSDPAEIIYFDTDEWYSVDSTQTFGSIGWLAFEPNSNTIYLGGDDSGTVVVKSVSATDGKSNLQTVGIDQTQVSSVSFDRAGRAYAGYWGGGYYSGLSATFPDGLTSGSPDATLTYWVAGSFDSSDGGDATLPETGTDTDAAGLAFAFGIALAACGAVLVARSRRS